MWRHTLRDPSSRAAVPKSVRYRVLVFQKVCHSNDAKRNILLIHFPELPNLKG